MMLFLEVEARDMDQNAKDKIYSIFKIEVNDLNHEQMIRSVLTYPYEQPMFRITEYVSKFKTYLSKPLLQPSEYNKTKNDYVDLLDDYYVEYAKKVASKVKEKRVTKDDTTAWLDTSLSLFEEKNSRGFYPHSHCICSFVSACDEIGVQNYQGKI